MTHLNADQRLINGVTIQVGTSCHLSGNPIYQELARIFQKKLVDGLISFPVVLSGQAGRNLRWQAQSPQKALEARERPERSERRFYTHDHEQPEPGLLGLFQPFEGLLVLAKQRTD